MTETVTLDRADIQGNIVRPYGFRHGHFLFVRFDDPDGARQWLGRLPVMSAAPWPDERDERPKQAVNVALTHKGLDALGVPRDLLDTFPDVFRCGMLDRAATLGDVGCSAPDRWDRRLRGEAHAVVTIHADRPDRARAVFDEMQEGVRATAGAVAYVTEIRCDNPEGQREHFGFADGFGQPAIEGSGYEHLPGQGKPGPGNRWDPLKPGEFVLGYEDEDGVLPAAPDAPLGANGSYMVLRKLEQNVPHFRRYVAETAHAYGLPVELLAAKLVGRWKDGTPLVRSPQRPDRSISGCEREINNFRYVDDPDGYRCPVGAHIRRTNPRDSMEREGQLTKRHRMLRRGMPYGDPLAEGESDDKRRGLVFVCYVANLERQFELVQRKWCNDGDQFWLGSDRDFITGRSAVDGERLNKMTVEGRDPLFLEQPPEPFVTTKGGDYYFAPGLRALGALAAGAW